MNQSTDRLRELLARYEAAETTVAEERELKELLRSPDLPKEFYADAAFFGVQQVLAKAKMPLSQATTANSPWESTTGSAQPDIRTATTLSVATRHNFRVFFAIAAVLLIAVVVGLYQLSDLNSSNTQPIAQAAPIDWSKYEVTDPEEATRITRAAFATVSHGIESGGRITSKGISRIEPIHHAIKSKS